MGDRDINIQVLNKINGIYDLDKQHIFFNLRLVHSNQNVSIRHYIKLYMIQFYARVDLHSQLLFNSKSDFSQFSILDWSEGGFLLYER